MNPLYAESSALLTWLLGQTQLADVQGSLQAASMVVTSDLSLVECERGLHRLAAAGTLTNQQYQERRDRLVLAASHWTLMALDREILEGTRQRFPVEPLRSLDALHLSSALKARRMLPSLVMLSLDRRIRDNAPQLGLPLLP